MKELLTQMFNGWLLRETNQDEIVAMTKACEGDRLKGELLVLFGYWSNDILAVAASYGITIKDGKVVEIEPAPSSAHWYNFEEHRWMEPISEEKVSK